MNSMNNKRCMYIKNCNIPSMILNYYLSSHHKVVMPCTSAIFTGDASAKDIDTAMKLGAGNDHVFILFFIASFKLIVTL